MGFEVEAKRAAIRLLASRSHFSSELRRKLAGKGYPREAIEEALRECTRLGYLNDEERTRAFIEREKQKGNGPALIAYKLKEKGMNAEVAFDQEEAIRRLLPRYRLKDRVKTIRSLCRKGFGLESILRSLA